MSVSALVLAPSWPPDRSPRATMSHRLLSSLDWRGRVIVADRRAVFPMKSEACGAGQLDVLRSGARLDLRFFDALGSFVPELVHLPDSLASWAIRAAAIALSGPKPELLVSISKADSAHLAALLVLARWPKLPWIAYFSDPWVDMERYGYVRYGPLSRPFNRALEGRVLDRADRLGFTNAEGAALVTKRRPDVRDRTFVLSQCFDAERYPTPPSPLSNAPLLVRYLGDFYGVRSPMPVLRALERLEAADPDLAARLHVSFVGKLASKDASACRALAARLQTPSFEGSVPYGISLARMVEADVLLVLDAATDSSPFLPSKLVDYLGADRPIVAISPPGPAEQLVVEAGGLVANPADQAGIEGVFREVLRRHADATLATLRPHPEVRSRYEKHRVAASFDQTARALLATRERA